MNPQPMLYATVSTRALKENHRRILSEAAHPAWWYELICCVRSWPGISAKEVAEELTWHPITSRKRLLEISKAGEVHRERRKRLTEHGQPAYRYFPNPWRKG